MASDGLTPNERDVLRVCQGVTAKPGDWFAGSYVFWECKRQGTPFHQSTLGNLARKGWLEKGDGSRQGNRRYYRQLKGYPELPR